MNKNICILMGENTCMHLNDYRNEKDVLKNVKIKD
jgi:hypothetical protein